MHRSRVIHYSSWSLAVLLGGLGIAVAFVAFGSRGGPPSLPISDGLHTDPTFGWTMEVSDGLRLAPMRTVGGRASVSGAVISNFRIEHPESLAQLRDFPPDGVLLRIWHDEGGLAFPISENDDSFPISIRDLHPIDRYVGGREPQPVYEQFFADGTPFNVAAWIAPHASDTTRTAIAQTLSSLRFPATRTGTVANQRLIVMASVSMYPIGSVTRYDRTDLPLDPGPFVEYKGAFSFYLVHGSSGFYAIATDFLGNGQRCDLQLDRSPMTFSCPSTGWSWDREGRTLSRGEGWPDGQSDLLVLPAPISWNGHVMIDPFGNWPPSAAAAWSSS